MPKHIKISKHPDTRKFYVSDVCEFLSVEVQECLYYCLMTVLEVNVLLHTHTQELVAYYQ